ncbi:MAG TPA: hypothetical protein VFO39_21495 [Candidatus Sulfotelmatobacter sp.]|nr:hypothetical protein [Candidatus Sulfotelmatobacter sp.]
MWLLLHMNDLQPKRGPLTALAYELVIGAHNAFTHHRRNDWASHTTALPYHDDSNHTI